ncbi:MAG: hypothetical protein AAFW73_03635 [Bacteroidota bacterium]
MTSIQFYFPLLLALLVASCSPSNNENIPIVKASSEAVNNLEAFALPGANVLAFGPDQVLFIGDSKGAMVRAIATSATAQQDPVPYNLKGLSKRIAEKLDIVPANLIINDMKIHPLSQEAYIAVKKGHQPSAPSFIAIVRPQDGQINLLNYAEATKSEVALVNPVNPDYTFWKDLPASSLNITDLDYHDGFLYVAGLSNGEFASNLRKIAYPFSDQQAKVGSIEMYHAVHTQKETRAPIRAMVFDELDGASTLIASYTCTPLVTIPTADIQEGKHIKAKTIAELGFGNAPVDMLTFMVQEQDGSFDKKLLITHKQRGGNVISLKDLAEANQGAGMEGKFTMGPEGVKLFQVSTANVLHIDDQNQMMLAALRRNMENGDLELVSQLKGSYFRLSDFVSEYNFPDYRYPEEQEGTKKFHDMVKPMEGYPELTSEKMGRE